MPAIKKKKQNKQLLCFSTYEVNNSVNCIRYEGTCLRGKLPDTAVDNNMQMIDRSFLSRLPTQSTNHVDINMETYSLKMKQTAFV